MAQHLSEFKNWFEGDDLSQTIDVLYIEDIKIFGAQLLIKADHTKPHPEG